MKVFTCPDGSNLIEVNMNNTLYHLCEAKSYEYEYEPMTKEQSYEYLMKLLFTLVFLILYAEYCYRIGIEF